MPSADIPAVDYPIDIPVDVDPRLTNEDKIMYSVEMVHRQADIYRWLCIVARKDFESAHAAIAELKAMYPDRVYRLIRMEVLL